MGCAQSKVDNEDSVARCKERRNLMKEAVSVRNIFAAAHCGFTVALKEIGAALSDYAQGEVPPRLPEDVGPSDLPASEQPPPPPPPHVEPTLPPPPPPLPTFSPIPPLKRATTMPAAMLHSENIKAKMKGSEIGESDLFDDDEEEEKGGLHRRKKGIERGNIEPPRQPSPNPATPPEVRGMAWDYFFIDEMPQRTLDEVQEEDDYMEEEAQTADGNFKGFGANTEFMTPEKRGSYEVIEDFKTPEASSVGVSMQKQFLHSSTAPVMVSRLGMTSGNKVGKNNGGELLRILSQIDDQFLKASESAQEVSKMLEATKLHYHSNFADNRGHIDHAQRVMQVITWNKSFRGAPPNVDGTAGSIDPEDCELHATVLDKLLAWEKKLYEEVKSAELIKLEYQRKVGVLNKLKTRSPSPEQLEKAKAAVSHLHTRYIVDMQSLDSTISEVTDIRDKQLYPKLVALVQGMAKMWESMCEHNDSQLKIVADLRVIEGAGVLIETSKEHHERTKQLAAAVEQWHSQFEKLVMNQRQYINTLNNWLKLNLVPIESTLKEKLSSPPRIPIPPIQPLLRLWHDHLEKLPDEVAKSAIFSFAEVIKSIFVHQEEEMKLKDRCESTRKEYLRKKQGFEEWYQKQMMKHAPHDVNGEMGAKDPVLERQAAVESLKKKLDEETEEHHKHCVQVREKSLASLKIRLPELFRALSDYSHACCDSYKNLRLLLQSQHVNPSA